MQIAVTDYTFPDLGLEESLITAAGFQLNAWKEKKSAAELPALVSEADAVITQFAPVNADVIRSMKRAKVIVRYGIGVDNVDLAVAKECGIPVCNVPDYCIDEVADHTLAFLLGTTRQVATSSNFVKGGRWGLATPLDRIQVLKNMTVGVVGFGRIGREVVSRLRAFKCRILVSDPIAAAADITAAGAVPVSLSDLLAQSDAITLHCPSTAETRSMLNSESLALTKRAEKLVTQIETALPNILGLTNQVSALLATSTRTLTTLDARAAELQPVVSNANFLVASFHPVSSNIHRISANLTNPAGSLGTWLLPTNLSTSAEQTLLSVRATLAEARTTFSNANSTLADTRRLMQTADGTLAHADTNLTTLALNLDRSLTHLANITSNLNAQVAANTNMLTEISSVIAHTDGLVQGLKNHWLMRSAFKEKPPAKPKK